MKLIKKAIGARARRTAKLLNALKDKDLDSFADIDIPESIPRALGSKYTGPRRANKAVQDILSTARELGIDVGKGNKEQQLARAVSKLKQTAGNPNTDPYRKLIAANPINNTALLSVPVAAVNPTVYSEISSKLSDPEFGNINPMPSRPQLPIATVNILNRPFQAIIEGASIRGNPKVRLQENPVTGRLEYVIPSAKALDDKLLGNTVINKPYFVGTDKLLRRINEGKRVNWDVLIPAHIRQATDYIRHISGDILRGRMPELKENFIKQLETIPGTFRRISYDPGYGGFRTVVTNLDGAIKEKIFDSIAKNVLKRHSDVTDPEQKAELLRQAVSSHPLYRRLVPKLESYAKKLLSNTPEGTLLSRVLGLPSQIEEDLQTYKVLSSGRHGDRKFIDYSELRPRKDILRTYVNKHSPVSTPTLTVTSNAVRRSMLEPYPTAEEIAANKPLYIRRMTDEPSMHFSKHPTVNLQYLEKTLTDPPDPHKEPNKLSYIAEYKEPDLVRRMGGLQAKPVYSAITAMPTIGNKAIANMAQVVTNVFDDEFNALDPMPIISHENLAIYPWYEIAYPSKIFDNTIINPLLSRLYKVMPGRKIRLQEVYRKR